MKHHAWIAVTALVTFSAPAAANGRFPGAQQLVEAAADPDHLVVQATFGLVTSFDGGSTWGWTCERAIGYVGELDPPLAINQDGAMFAGLFDGLATSTPDGCGWQFVSEPVGQRYVIDVSARRTDPRDVVALSTDGLGSDLFDSRLFRSDDGGATFVQPGEPLPSDFLGETVDVAPSDPERMYLTGFFALGDGKYSGAFGRSNDGGATFELATVEGTDERSAPFLAAVDPSNPDILYVRLSGMGARLLRSEDGGMTFTQIAELEGYLQGFALSPDGSEIALGGPSDDLRVGPAAGGAFEVVSSARPACLTWTERGLYACGSETREGFTVGLSQDRGVTFDSLFSRLCLEGPLDCADGTMVGDLCDADWEVARPTIGADRCSSGVGGGSAASSSMVTGTGTGAGAGAGAGGGEGSAPAEDGGCCTIAAGAPPPRSAPPLLAAAIGLLAFVMRRRGAPSASRLGIRCQTFWIPALVESKR